MKAMIKCSYTLKKISMIIYNIMFGICFVISMLAMFMMAHVGIDLSDDAIAQPEIIAGGLIIACMILLTSILITHKAQEYRFYRSALCIGQMIALSTFVIMSLSQIQTAALNTQNILQIHLSFINYAFSYTVASIGFVMILIIVDAFIYITGDTLPIAVGEKDYTSYRCGWGDFITCIFALTMLVIYVIHLQQPN